MVMIKKVPWWFFVSLFFFLKFTLISGCANFDLFLEHSSGWARSYPEFQGYRVAATDAAAREFEPVAENSTAVVVGVIGKQTMETILLLASTAIATVHLFMFVSVEGNFFLFSKISEQFYKIEQKRMFFYLFLKINFIIH